MMSLTVGCVALPAAGQSIQPIYCFTNGPAHPIAGLTWGPDGNFYGTTYLGGNGGSSGYDADYDGYGTVFKMSTNGEITLLASLDGTNGEYAVAGVTFGSDGNLYGGGVFGGADGRGTLFRVSTNGIITTLHSFGTWSGNGIPAEGEFPGNSLTMGPDGNLYGTSAGGGGGGPGGGGTGVIFRMATNGTLTMLYAFGSLFSTTNGYSTNFDGATPGPLTLGADGNLYGTTWEGGGSGSGTVFRMTTNGALSTLYSFSAPVTNGAIGTNSDGAAPIGLTLGPDGNFYGTTYRGGAGGCGTVFQITTNGSITTLASFVSSNEYLPSVLTLGPDGNFYGTTFLGGALGQGTIFQVTTNGGLTTLYSFTTPPTTGMNYTPSGLTLGPDGQLYGTRYQGIFGDGGVVFKISTNGVFNTIAKFSSPHGLNPYNGLRLGLDGNLYGTTSFGGTNREGTAFVITNGLLTTLGSFAATPSRLSLGANGQLYGITEQGSNGSIFNITSAGTVETLANFVFENNAGPHGDLTLGPNGNFYDVTYYGGTNGSGSVCEITTNGAYRNVVSFGSAPGANPFAGLTLAPDGNFYGTTELGGSNYEGTVFRFATDGTLTSLYSFGPLAWSALGSSNIDGADPEAALTVGPDGNLYGATPEGGIYGRGTFFQLTTNGTMTVLASFTHGEGASEVALTLGPDGNFYGVTVTGGSSSNGTVFRATTSGVITTLASFASSDGTSPSALTLGWDGNFYGTRGRGGPGDGGVIYRLNLPPSIITQPSNRIVRVGDQASFGIALFGTAPFTYQWLSNCAQIDGATNGSLMIPNVTASGVGDYQIVVSNSWGSVTSSVASLSLGVAPTITNQPMSESVPIGGTTHFSVGAGGSPPMAYQWYFNSSAALAGATNDCLSFGPTLTTQAGDYQVIVTSPYGSATSSVAGLNVLLRPNCYGISNSGSGPVTLFLASAPGSTNRLWATTNLNLPFTQWQPISTNAADASGLFQFTDMNAAGSSARFYILSSP